VAHVGSWDWDFATNVVNRSLELSRILGAPAGESVVTAADMARVHPEDRDRVQAQVARAIRDRVPFRAEYRVVRPDAECVVEARGEVVYDPAGRPLRMTGTLQDVSERKESETRLMLSGRMASIGTLAAGVAHEVNNPLATVTMNLDMIAEELRALGTSPSPAKLRELEEMASEARNGAERMRKIVRGLRTFSRREADRRQPLDVRGVLELAINMTFNEIRHRARLVKDFGDVPPVLADEASLGQVFMNLLMNASEAVPTGHTEQNEIRLVTRRTESGVMLEVRDTGRGIPPEQLGRIFDPFFTTKEVGTGTGLGLSICHAIVAAHGGEITAESTVGRGSVFRVLLPAARLDDVAPPPEPPVAPARPARRGRVLIVDDDPFVNTMLARALALHEVVVATSGRDALARLAGREPIDVVFCDMSLSDMTAMDLHAAVGRTRPELVERIVFVIGATVHTSARAFLDQVPNERMEKPFDVQNLRAVVQRFVRQG
jgi:PAS domain S-box-containing protein